MYTDRKVAKVARCVFARAQAYTILRDTDIGEQDGTLMSTLSIIGP